MTLFSAVELRVLCPLESRLAMLIYYLDVHSYVHISLKKNERLYVKDNIYFKIINKYFVLHSYYTNFNPPVMFYVSSNIASQVFTS